MKPIIELFVGDNYLVKELGLLLVLVAVAILTYASLVYFAEKDFSNEEGLNCTDWKPDYKLGKLCPAPTQPCIYNFAIFKL